MSGRMKLNKYEKRENGLSIILSNSGEICLIDPEDYKKVFGYTWVQTPDGYAMTTERKTNKTVLMHRLILGALDGETVDHISRNGLDNRKRNLRIATYQENNMNRGSFKNNTTGYKGIYKNKTNGKWYVQIGVNNRMKYIGTFSRLEDAVIARRQAEEKYFGEFAPKEVSA